MCDSVTEANLRLIYVCNQFTQSLVTKLLMGFSSHCNCNMHIVYKYLENIYCAVARFCLLCVM